MNTTSAYSSKPSLSFDPTFVMGMMIALYFLLGRWTFHRLQGEEDTQSLFGQPRVWVICTILAIAGFVFAELHRRRWSEVCAIDLAVISWLFYMLISTIWAPSSEFLEGKVAEVVMLLVVAISIALARSRATNAQLHRGFWWGLVLIGGAMGFFTLAMITDGRAYVPTGGPNIFGRNMGLVGIGALMLATQSRSWVRIGLYLVVILSPMWVVMTGSRGALLSTGVAGLVLFVMSKARLTTKLAAIAFIIAASLTAFLGTEAGRNALQVFEHRILKQTIEQRYTADRDDLFEEAFAVGMERPTIGAGLSGFRAGSWTYPHNIVLETFAEGGLVGVSLLLISVLIWWMSLKGRSLKIPGTVVAAMALLFTSASFSGNYYDSRGIFLYLAISIVPIVGSRKPQPRHESYQQTAPASGMPAVVQPV